MPVKNIIPGQKVTKEKLERAKELRREMTPAEKLLWQEVPPTGTCGALRSWESAFEGTPA
jgi:very-short-patch-repair endonuclease